MSVTTDKKQNADGGIVEILKICVQALLIAVVIRTLAFQPFNIPSGSMEKTLLVGDYLFVSKYAYGYSKNSMPFSPPLFSGRLFGSEPKRGDIAVFKQPPKPSVDFIKRVVGLPGDTIQMLDGVLQINGVAVPKERIEDYVVVRNGQTWRIPRYRETLPNGASYEVLDEVQNGYYDTTIVYEVPAGHYFMMGDNRDNSADSRVISEVGYVPFENFVGRAELLFFSVDGEPAWAVWKWPWSVRWSRLGTSLR